jgi:hypothetical protein
MPLKNKRLWIFTGLLLIVVSISVVIGYLYWKNTNFSCNGDMIIHRKDTIANVTVQYIFNGNTGAVILRGEIKPNNAPAEFVSQNVFFDMKRQGDDYFLVSRLVYDSTGNPTDLPLLKRTLPLFYLQPDKEFYLNIKQLSGTSWLFSTSRSPSLLCSK